MAGLGKALKQKRREQQKSNAKKVFHFNLDGEFIRSYDFISIAAEVNKTSPAIISKCCNGRLNRINNNVFLFKKEASNFESYFQLAYDRKKNKKKKKS